MTHNPTLDQLNDALQEWKSMFLFYARDAVALGFSSTPDNQLCFNQLPLCTLSDLSLEDTMLDIEHIRFQFSQSRSLVIHMTWPEEAPPYPKSVFFGYFFLTPKHDAFNEAD